MDEKINSQISKSIPKSTTQMHSLSPGTRAEQKNSIRLYSQMNLYKGNNDLDSEHLGVDQQPQTSRGPVPFNLSHQNQLSYLYSKGTPSPSVSKGTLENQDVRPQSIDSDQPNMKEDLNLPQPLVQSGYDLEADMMFGWRPDDLAIPGAPIPLHYNFGRCEIPVNPYTNSIPEPLYLGARIPTSLQVHKMFANRPESTGCDSTLKSEPYPSYKAVIPKKLPYKIKNKEPLRKFIGMDPSVNLNCELKFDSLFECGNLDMVTKVRNNEYDLYMRVDTNTTGHHQWFYYSVQYSGKMFKKQKVTFNICNFTKPASLYSYGMRVCMAKRSKNYLWHKGGDDISYSKGRVIRINHSDPARVRYYFKLTFSITLEKEEDKIYFAYSYPYSFSKLANFIQGLNTECKNKDLLKEGVLCRDLSGVQVPLLTITSRLQSDPKQYNLIKMSEFSDENDLISLPLYKKKKFCIVGARVHPGETPASWMMQGFLKCLTGNSLQAEQLRKRVVFKIVPMSNPDGVISGNYRTSMAGCDLNRRYDDPDFRFHPTVFSIKNMAEDILNGDPLKGFGPFATPDDMVAFVDMHGHSRKKNVFIYGPPVPLHSEKYYKVRFIPKLLSDETEMFRYHSCRYSNEKSKRTTARIVLNKELGIYNCFTFEASFHCYYDHERVNHEFTPAMYEAMGANLVNSLYEYMMIVEEEERCKQAKMVEKQKRQKQAENQHEMLKQQLQEAMQTQNSQFSKVAQDSLKHSTSINKTSFLNKLFKAKKKGSDSKLSGSNLSLGRLNSATVPQNSAKVLNPNVPDFDGVTLSANGDQQPPKSRIFRNILDILGELKKFEQQHDSSDEEPGTSGDEHYQATYKETRQGEDKAGENSDEDEDTGELNQNQMQGLQNEILDAIKEFTKVSKISKQDYYGEIAKQADKRRLQKAMRDKSQQQQQVNYQSQTVSIGIKRRSFINFTDLLSSDSPVAKPIVKTKAKPEVRVTQQSPEKSADKFPQSKPQNLSQMLLHPINLNIEKQPIQSSNIISLISIQNQVPNLQTSLIPFIENQKAPKIHPATNSVTSQAQTPKLVFQLIKPKADQTENNSALKEPNELRTQQDQPTQALKKYINVNNWPFVGTLPGIQSPSQYNQVLQDLMMKNKKIKPLFGPKKSIEIQCNKPEEQAIDVQPQTTTSSLNFMNIKSPLQQVVAKPVTNFVFEEVLNPKIARKKSEKQSQMVKRAKNKVIRISDQTLKSDPITLVSKDEPIIDSRQSKPTTILFGASESNIGEKLDQHDSDSRGKSKQQIMKYGNQGMKQMMARKVKLVNAKDQDSKKIDQNTVELLQKQQQIQQQQLSYRNSTQDASNFFANRSVKHFYQNQQTAHLSGQKNIIQQIGSDLSITSFVAEQLRGAAPARFESSQTWPEEAKQLPSLKQQDPPTVLQNRAIHSQGESRDPRSPLQLSTPQKFSPENVKKIQFTSFQALQFSKRQAMINQKQHMQQSLQQKQMQRIIKNSLSRK